MDNVKNTISILKKIETFIIKKNDLEHCWFKKGKDCDKINDLKKIFGEELFKHEIEKIEKKYRKYLKNIKIIYI